MALLHRASIVPTKLEAINAWLPQQPWALDAGEVETLGAFRFDDPPARWVWRPSSCATRPAECSRCR